MAQDEPTTYPGNCHCGAVRFEIHLARPFQMTFACPCRLCAKTGCPWIFAEDNELKFTRGRDTLARYKTQKGEHEVQCPESPAGIQSWPHGLDFFDLLGNLS